MPLTKLKKSPRKFLRLLKKNDLILVLIFLIGIFFRFYNLNWDEGYSFHPDERNIAASVSRIRFFSQMNPQFFAYGSFPIYLYRATGDLLNYLFKDDDWNYNWAKINVVGRWWSAFFSSLTLIFVYKLATKLFNNKVGMIAFFLTAFTAFLIQTAHFAVTESLLTFFIVIIVYLSLNILEKPSFSQSLKLVLTCGLALSTKISALTFFLPPTFAFLYLAAKNFKEKQFDRVISNLFNLFSFLLLSFCLFLIVCPFTLLDFEKFMESMKYEGGIVTGRLIVCYVYQFIKTQPYIYWVKNWVFTQGPLLALTSVLSFSYIIYLTLRERNIRFILLVIWPIVYFAIVGRWFAKFVRYLAPLYPFLAIFSAKFLVDFNRTFKNLKFILFLVLTTTFLYSLAFETIYFRPQTRILASNWIYQNIPPGAKVLTEHWDDGLPVSTELGNPGFYRIEQLTIYEPDNQEKINYYAKKLSEADYIVINSRRLYGTLINLPERYPITSRYYKLLFSGELGYEKVAQFTSYPALKIGKWQIEFNDDSSEETFQVYDHPKVMIFKNRKKFSREILLERLYHETLY